MPVESRRGAMRRASSGPPARKLLQVLPELPLRVLKLKVRPPWTQVLRMPSSLPPSRPLPYWGP